MSVFAVRIAESFEVVGLFSATSITRLRDVVDECTDPGICEYVRLSSLGGAFVPHRTKAQWPPRSTIDDELHADDGSPFNDAVISDLWLIDINEGRWKSLGAME